MPPQRSTTKSVVDRGVDFDCKVFLLPNRNEEYMTAINTPYATLSFANIFTPRPRAENGDPVYSCSLLFDPAQQKSPAYKALQDACIAAAHKEWGETSS